MTQFFGVFCRIVVLLLIWVFIFIKFNERYENPKNRLKPKGEETSEEFSDESIKLLRWLDEQRSKSTPLTDLPLN